jgi:hypothetical protein
VSIWHLECVARGDVNRCMTSDGLQNNCSLFVIGIRHLYPRDIRIRKSDTDENMTYCLTVDTRSCGDKRRTERREKREERREKRKERERESVCVCVCVCVVCVCV